MQVLKSALMVMGVAFFLALAGCVTKPIYSVNDAPVISASGKSLDKSQVRTAIINAGVSLGWQVVEVSPGVLQGTLKLRDHTAVVNIPYSATKYSIVFKSGVNLGEADGQIHRNYNGWVQNFDKAIRALLLNA